MNPPRESSSEVKAWACLGTNALVLPGLGSIIGGRVASGVAQAAAALVGFAMTMYWALTWLWQVWSERALPESFGPRFRYGAFGIVLFAGAWLWSLTTGWSFVRRARRAASP